VNELGLKMELGGIDAAVVWRCIALRYPRASDIVTIDPAKNICPNVGGAVLRVGKNPRAAAEFLEFLTSARGREVLTENGYTVDKP
jgi:ABC-type molybdate transport system substrate-binding protein